MSMYDDLDSDFSPSPGAALPIVAARVRAIRVRRLITVSALFGTIAVVVLTSMAFGSGGDRADRVTVATDLTTTTESSPSTTETLSTEPTTTEPTTTEPTTTLPETTTVFVAPDTTPAPTESTTTVLKPAHLTVSFDRDRLVIQSGTREAIEYTVTNDGDESAPFAYPPARCVPDISVWPDDQSRSQPVLWPLPVQLHQYCLPLESVTVPAHGSQTLRVTIAAGLRDDSPNNLVPAPPGETSFFVRNYEGGGEGRLPVTITPPATPPLTVSHPSSVTTASGAQHFVNFTITNHLAFPVRFVEQGPCALDGDAPCRAIPGSIILGDIPPPGITERPLYFTSFILDANETRTVRAEVDGTTTLRSTAGSADLPPGFYHFLWDGEVVKFTVTP